MEVKDEKVVSLFPTSGNSGKKGGDGGGAMNVLIKRVESLKLILIRSNLIWLFSPLVQKSSLLKRI
jgi:hypothetical protein